MPYARTGAQCLVLVEKVIEILVHLIYLESIKRYLGRKRSELLIKKSGLYTV